MRTLRSGCQGACGVVWQENPCNGPKKNNVEVAIVPRRLKIPPPPGDLIVGLALALLAPPFDTFFLCPPFLLPPPIPPPIRLKMPPLGDLAAAPLDLDCADRHHSPGEGCGRGRACGGQGSACHVKGPPLRAVGCARREPCATVDASDISTPCGGGGGGHPPLPDIGRLGALIAHAPAA